MKRGATFLTVKKMQIKTTMRCHYNALKWLKLKKTNRAKGCQECGATATLLGGIKNHKIIL